MTASPGNIEQPDPPDALGSEAAGPPEPPVALWTARTVGVVSLLLGFPAGIGLTAVNWFRLGRRWRAVTLLALGILVLFALVLAPGDPRPIGLPASVAIGLVLLRLTGRDERRISGAGRKVVQPGIGAGFATIIAAWVLVFSPVAALEFLGQQVESLLAGTVEFGTGGSGCSVSRSGTTFAPDQSIHLAAHLRRNVAAGEVVQATLSLDGRTLASDVIQIDQSANCMTGDLQSGFAVGGSYTIEYAVGTEILARGQVVIGRPSAGSGSSAP